MFDPRLSPQLITSSIICFILAPRLLSTHAFTSGTLCILLFWTAMLVLLPDYINHFDKKILFSKLSLFTKIVLISIILINSAALIWRQTLFNETSYLINNYRQSLYLINPLVCVVWLPLVEKDKKIRFLGILIILTAMIWITLKGPSLLKGFGFVQSLNELTCLLSSFIMSLFIDQKVYVEGEYFYTNYISVRVGSGCSSIPQIFISGFALLVFYMCSKISMKNILIVIMFSTIITFFINAIRIFILGMILQKNNYESFEFWHEGTGSLIFSIIIMSICSYIYYLFWNREFNLSKVDKN